MSLTLIVYGKPQCPQCDTVKRHLDRLKVSYAYLDVTRDEAAKAHVQSLGYSGVPVVVAGDQHRQGYRPDWLNEVARLLPAAGIEECEPAAAVEMLPEDGAA